MIFLYKKAVLFLIMGLIFFSAMPSYALHESNISATSAIVMDTITGRVLFEKNAHQKRTMASTTKIMTGILALEKGELTDIVTTSRNAAYVEGSSIWLEEGEKQTLEDLIYAVLLSSGNDAAIVIAEHIGGSVEGFADIMTQKAREIGAINTSFKNPHGLDEEGHYTTAYDLALITRYALQHEKFAKIVKTKKKKIPWESSEWDRLLKNHNKLLHLYEGCDGVKTGFTKKSGRCLVSSATRDGWQIVAVTLNAPNDWEDHKKMFDDSFKRYTVTKVVENNKYVKTLPVAEGKQNRIALYTCGEFYMPLQENELTNVHITHEMPSSVEAPIRQGQQIGSVNVLLDDTIYTEIPLITNQFIERKDLKLAYAKIMRNWLMLFRNRYFFRIWD